MLLGFLRASHLIFVCAALSRLASILEYRIFESQAQTWDKMPSYSAERQRYGPRAAADAKIHFHCVG
jgi:hypothetical protein